MAFSEAGHSVTSGFSRLAATLQRAWVPGISGARARGAVSLGAQAALTSTGIALAVGLPLLWVVLTLMDKSGELWWLYTWLVWGGFQLLMMLLLRTLDRLSSLDGQQLITQLHKPWIRLVLTLSLHQRPFLS